MKNLETSSCWKYIIYRELWANVILTKQEYNLKLNNILW